MANSVILKVQPTFKNLSFSASESESLSTSRNKSESKSYPTWNQVPHPAVAKNQVSFKARTASKGRGFQAGTIQTPVCPLSQAAAPLQRRWVSRSSHTARRAPCVGMDAGLALRLLVLGVLSWLQVPFFDRLW